MPQTQTLPPLNFSRITRCKGGSRQTTGRSFRCTGSVTPDLGPLVPGRSTRSLAVDRGGSGCEEMGSVEGETRTGVKTTRGPSTFLVVGLVTRIETKGLGNNSQGTRV